MSSYGGCSFRLGQIQAQPKSEPNGKQGGHIPWVQVAIDYFQDTHIGQDTSLFNKPMVRPMDMYTPAIPAINNLQIHGLRQIFQI